MSTVEIYTDGACRGNPGPGGWAALLSVDGREKEIAGAEALTTNNRMELTAVIRALEALRRSVRVRVFTDSQYVRRGITEWWVVYQSPSPGDCVCNLRCGCRNPHVASSCYTPLADSTASSSRASS